MQIEFSQVVQRETDRHGLEMSARQIYDLLVQEYLEGKAAYVLKGHRLVEENGITQVEVEVEREDGVQSFKGTGNGPLEALVAALPVELEIMDYSEHAIGAGSDAKAAAYIELRVNGGRPLHGVGIDGNLTTASFRALFSALNRALN